MTLHYERIVTMYKRHIEFQMDASDLNVATSRWRSKTIADMFVYNDCFLMKWWDTERTYRPAAGVSQDYFVECHIKSMQHWGYSVISDNFTIPAPKKEGTMYNRYLELMKNETDTHPQTGESKAKTIVDVYVYADRVEVWGWGWVNTFRPTNRSIDDIVNTIKDVFLKDSYEILNDEKKDPNRFQDTDKKAAHSLIFPVKPPAANNSDDVRRMQDFLNSNYPDDYPDPEQDDEDFLDI